MAMRSAGLSFLRRTEHSDPLPRSLTDGIVMVDVFWEIFHLGIHTFSTREVCDGVGDEKNEQLMD